MYNWDFFRLPANMFQLLANGLHTQVVLCFSMVSCFPFTHILSLNKTPAYDELPVDHVLLSSYSDISDFLLEFISYHYSRFLFTFLKYFQMDFYIYFVNKIYIKNFSSCLHIFVKDISNRSCPVLFLYKNTFSLVDSMKKMEPSHFHDLKKLLYPHGIN